MSLNPLQQLRRIIAPDTGARTIATITSVDRDKNIVTVAYAGRTQRISTPSGNHQAGDQIIIEQGAIVGKAESSSLTIWID